MSSAHIPNPPSLEDPTQRSETSGSLSEIEARRLRRTAGMDPGVKIAYAFTLSVEARKLRVSALRAQGFPDPEILSILKAEKR